MRFPDQASAARGLLASGVAERAVRNSGEEAVSKGVKEAIQAARKEDASYVFSNAFCFLVSRL
jgi:histone H3/H4